MSITNKAFTVPPYETSGRDGIEAGDTPAGSPLRGYARFEYPGRRESGNAPGINRESNEGKRAVDRELMSERLPALPKSGNCRNLKTQFKRHGVDHRQEWSQIGPILHWDLGSFGPQEQLVTSVGGLVPGISQVSGNGIISAYVS